MCFLSVFESGPAYVSLTVALQTIDETLEAVYASWAASDPPKRGPRSFHTGTLDATLVRTGHPPLSLKHEHRNFSKSQTGSPAGDLAPNPGEGMYTE